MITPNSIRIAFGAIQFGLPYGIANKIGQVSHAEAKTMRHLAAANN